MIQIEKRGGWELDRFKVQYFINSYLSKERGCPINVLHHVELTKYRRINLLSVYI